ncbi:hypothetical protein J6S39_01355 [Candidatus Saccharibacteria bacterium]|nr:hypothetical protein [Candidatus Saccharibacteria bacterium]
MSIKRKSYKIIEDLNETDPPKVHEKKAVKIIAEYFKSDVNFLRKTINSSPDIKVVRTREIWEIKSPLGGSKRTIDNNLREASDQSAKVFLDLSRCKMNQSEAVSRAKNFCFGKYQHRCHLKKLKIILKNGKIVDIL